VLSRPSADSFAVGRRQKFDKDKYVFNIIEHGYKIPVKMTPVETSQHYRERNNQSVRNEMPFVRADVARLVADGQVIAMENIPLCCNPLSVAFKVNMDGTIKRRLVIDLSRWVNKFIPASKYLMSKFQDALVMTSPGDFQSVFNIWKAYHYLRLAPESYELVGFCVPDEKGIDWFYHFVVGVFGLAPAGQLLGRIMRPVLVFLFTVPLNHAQVVRATSRETNIGDLVGVMWDTQKVLSQLFSPMAFRETGGHIYTRILH
jgi:hypothetical protein